MVVSRKKTKDDPARTHLTEPVRGVGDHDVRREEAKRRLAEELTAAIAVILADRYLASFHARPVRDPEVVRPPTLRLHRGRSKPDRT
jgi:hypothetical protein